MSFPRADGFLYCITLRFGVYCVCLYDTVSGVFDIVGSVTTLMYPEIMLRSQVAPPTPSLACCAATLHCPQNPYSFPLLSWLFPALSLPAVWRLPPSAAPCRINPIP